MCLCDFGSHIIIIVPPIDGGASGTIRHAARCNEKMQLLAQGWHRLLEVEEAVSQDLNHTLLNMRNGCEWQAVGTLQYVAKTCS